MKACSLFDPAGGEVEPARRAELLMFPVPMPSRSPARTAAVTPFGAGTEWRTATPLTERARWQALLMRVGMDFPEYVTLS